MKRQLVIANSLLWAAAIVASALVSAPPLVTLIFLPCLAAGFLLTSQDTSQRHRASRRS